MTASSIPTPTAADCPPPAGPGGPCPADALSRTISLPTQIETTVRGYRMVSAAERAGFWMLTSFAVTVGAARAINFARERRRTAPRLRSWARRTSRAAKREGVRIHHFIPGIVLAFVSGGGAILTRGDGHELVFSLAFGTGAGLTLDEIAILTEVDDPYWASERLAAAQMAAAALGAAALLARFRLCGAQKTASPAPE